MSFVSFSFLSFHRRRSSSCLVPLVGALPAENWIYWWSLEL